jgi:hypothetical protein
MIRVTGTNAKTGNLSYVRVYLNDERIAEVVVSRRKPVEYLRGLTRSKYFKSLEQQMMPYGVTLSDIGMGGRG